MRKVAFLPLFVGAILQAQNINIGNFYYRDYLDFGQNKGSFSSGNTTLTGKDGTSISVSNVPNFAASSNYGSLTSVGRGFVVTANHVSSPQDVSDLRKFGLTEYTIGKDENHQGETIDSISQPYGRDEKFLRFTQYIVEGKAEMLNIDNSKKQGDTTKISENLEKFKTELKNFTDEKGNVYLYQAGSGIIKLYDKKDSNKDEYIYLAKMNGTQDGSTKGGGFGTLDYEAIIYGDLATCQGCPIGDSQGIVFNYSPDKNFNNRITVGDSGSGIYAYSKDKGWILLGVVSQTFEHLGQNDAKASFVSQKDLEDYQKKFEQHIALDGKAWTLNNTSISQTQSNPANTTLQQNKDFIFSGGGNIEVTSNLYRNSSGQAGGFVFTATNSATAQNPTKYTFTNKGDYFFTGSGLDIGENVIVEWALRNKSGESLHKIGKGELIVKTAYTPKEGENLGYLKLGEGKVTLDTTNKAFEGIYITSGRGEVALKTGKAEAIGATKEGARDDITALSNAYTLAQNSTSEMGFYFGTGGGKLDLAGNSLRLNTIAANDSKAIITNLGTSLVDLQIEGFGYGADGKKTTNKADTIIHASFGELSANGASGTSANLNLIYKDSKADNANLIFDGHINIKGALSAENSNIVLQGHPTAHATISNEQIRQQIINAENGTSKPMSECMDLSKVSQLCQSDWDSRNFIIEKGIELKNATLTIGKAAKVTADINADNTSTINFGGTHFIDERDTKNVVGSGFAYTQLVKSGALANELYKDSAYSGTIRANGTTITSNFFNFAPNLELSNGANLSAKFLTLNTNSTLNFKDNSTAKVENLVLKEVSNLDGKITLNDSSKFEVTQSFTFDNSTFDLKNLQSKTNLTLPTEYNLYALNDSKITAGNFTNSKANAEFVLDNSTFSATSASFQSVKFGLQNGASASAESLNLGENSTLILDDKAKLTLTKSLQGRDLSVILDNESEFKASSGALSLTNLTLNLQNKSSFNADKLSILGNANITSDENSTLTLKTLELNGGEAILNAKANITNLHLDNVKDTTINSNFSVTNLNLSQSTARFGTLGNMQKVDLQNGSHLYFDELNLNTNTAILTSDESSVAHIKRLSFDTQTNSAQMPQSNLSVSELFELHNVGKNLGQTAGGEQEKLDKDLFALGFDKMLTLQSGAKLSVNFTELVKKDNANLQFNQNYKIFTAAGLMYGENLDIRLNLMGSGSDFFAKGKFDKDKNAFFVEFVRENPRNFAELNPHINPNYSAFLDILLEHNQFDESIEKAINMGDYSALNARLAGLDKSFENLANADNGALKTLPLLQKQEINARIQHTRFSNAKFALARMKNPTQQSDIVPKLLYLENEERKNRAWSNASASFFTNNGDKFSLQSLSIGYDRKLFGDEFLLGVMMSATNAQLSSNETNYNPKIYALALYSDALFSRAELQNELSFSLLNGDKDFEGESGSYKSFHSFFESIYKAEFAFLPQSVKPLALARVNLSRFDEFSTATYKQKADNDISVDLGLGFEWLWQKENGFYSATFIAERDIFHSQKESFISLKNAQKFIAYKTNEPSFSYQLYFSGLENFKNGFYLRYGLSAFIDSKAYKGVKGDVQVGYKF